MLHRPLFKVTCWHRWLLLAWWVLLFTNLPAQTQSPFQQGLERFAEQGPWDSLQYYVQRQSQLAQQADNFQLWAETQLKAQAFLSGENKQQGIQYAEALARQRWRSPRTGAEWEAWIKIEGRRAYDLKEQSKIVQAIAVIEPLLPIAEQHKMNELLDGFLYKFGGNLYTRLGDNEKALAIFEKALKISSEPEVLAGHYLNIGLAHWNQGQLLASSTAFERGLQQPGLSPTRQAQLWSALAQTELEQSRQQPEQLKQAALHSQMAIRKYPPTDTRLADALLTAALIALEQRANAVAGRYLDQAELLAQKSGIAPRDRGKQLIARSRWHLAAGQPDQALMAANAALSSLLPQFQPRDAFDQPDPATFFQENTLFEALEAKAAAAEAKNEPSWLELALQCHDLAWHAETLLREALIYQSSKLKLQNDSRLRDEAAIRIARRLYDRGTDPVYAKKALQVAERSKANLLLDALQENLLRQNLATNDPRFDQITALRHNMALLESKIWTSTDPQALAEWRICLNDLKTQATALERQLAADFPRLQLSESFSDANRSPLHEALQPDETGLVYFVSGQTLQLFVLNEQGIVEWQQIVLKGEVEAFLHWFRDASAIINDPEGYYQAAWKLHQTLLPVSVIEAKRLLIVPDGPLCLVPFEALLTAPVKGVSLRQAPYLIQKTTVSYAFSLATLARQRAFSQRSRQQLLGLAPLFAEQQRGLAPLIAGASEWQHWPGADSRSGVAASAQQFLDEAGRYRILHLSTHVSAGAHPRIEWFDRAMYLPEVYALPLCADLVVLSACETGLGQAERSEGLMSLSRAFAHSGAACIISSLWQVNDRSTARLFGHFYKALRQRQSIATALQSAQLAYLTDAEVNVAFQSPYFWAGFIPVGADRSIEPPTQRLWMYALGVLMLLLTILGWIRFRSGKKLKHGSEK
jgi:CHAT domain-containing protein